jgi:uncharacterized phage protein (TIGR01671 family)
MRVIKFRAWDFENKVMNFPTIEFNPKYVMQLNCSYMGEFNGKKYDSVKMILMQYTGLKDKNGKEIYEGDILVFTTLSDSGITETKHDPVFIQWNNYKSTYDFNDNKNRVLGDYPFFKYWTLESMRQYEVEVIGNIYENPNLIN